MRNHVRMSASVTHARARALECARETHFPRVSAGTLTGTLICAPAGAGGQVWAGTQNPPPPSSPSKKGVWGTRAKNEALNLFVRRGLDRGISTGCTDPEL